MRKKERKKESARNHRHEYEHASGNEPAEHQSISRSLLHPSLRSIGLKVKRSKTTDPSKRLKEGRGGSAKCVIWSNRSHKNIMNRLSRSGLEIAISGGVV